MEYIVKIIPKTEEGIAFNLEYYKPFRLRALQTDPSSFSSTYAREITYNDERWKLRLLNPLATTLIAVTSATNNAQGQDQDSKPPKILSSTTVVGPMATPPELLTKKQHDNSEDHRPIPTPTPLTWEINAVWTAPEARCHGITRHLMGEATRQVQVQAAALLAQGEKDARPVPELFLTVGVAGNNAAALSLYTQTGYLPFPEAEDEEVGLDNGGQKHIYLYLSVPHPGVAQGEEGE